MAAQHGVQQGRIQHELHPNTKDSEKQKRNENHKRADKTKNEPEQLEAREEAWEREQHGRGEEQVDPHADNTQQ